MPSPVGRGVIVALACAVLGAPAAAQVGDPLNPERVWRTVETRHFVVHYPEELGAWALPTAARLDSVHAAVGALVGNVPVRRVTVVVADPYNVSNGFAIPFLRTPTIVLWPTPPEPRTGIGEHRGWPELLAVHEYGHIAHLAWESRNPRERRLWSVLPVQLGPISRRAPRWVHEGYATYLEGRLTGSGRPHGTWRPTILRQWALEGRLPSYSQLSAWDAYQGGAMAYLAGSAYLEWLVERQGEESLTHLWRRMTALRRRSFADAFSGVFGAPPDELYGRFTVEVTRAALEAERRLTEAGLVEGDLYQRLGWHTGDPAVSPDGTRLALVLRAPDRPAHVVVWHTVEPPDTLAERERERLLEQDPLDVPAIEARPPPKRPIATLLPVAGRGHDQPRFFADGRRLLVTRAAPLPDGRVRADLFVWDSESGALRRVTRGAGVRHPDPAPDGRHAAAVRCEAGACDLVRIDLERGSLQVVQRGSPERVFYRPRFAPDGRSIAVAVQEAGRWRVAVTDVAGGAFRYLGPDDGASRYDAAWTAGGDALVVVSTRGGVPNLERIELATGLTRPLTRTTAAALAPAPNPADGSIFFLRLHSRGLDLHRLPAGAPPPETVVDLGPLPLAAPAPPPQEAPRFAPEIAAGPRPYRGVQTVRLLPAFATGGEGTVGALTLTGTDPIGRFAWTLSGAAGRPASWRGLGGEAVWRGWALPLHAHAWWARQRPAGAARPAEAAEALAAEYTGAALWTEGRRHTARGWLDARLGASYGRLADDTVAAVGRALAFLEGGARARFGGSRYLDLGLDLRGSLGSTGEATWSRGLATGRAAVGGGDLGVSFDVAHGLLGGDSATFELLSAGGLPPLVLDEIVLPQRLTQGALPTGAVSGRRLTIVRAALDVGAAAPYFWAASTDARLSTWHRVLGVERDFVIGPAPLARLPQVRLFAGLGYPLDEPFRHRLGGYVTVQYKP